MSHPFPHPFVTVQPDALGAAAGDLQGIGAQLAVSNAEVAPATTGIVPAAADEVSALNAVYLSTQAELYQAIAAQAAVLHERFANTLAVDADSYVDTEATNQAVAAASKAATPANVPQIPMDEIANFPAGLNFDEFRRMCAQPYGPPGSATSLESDLAYDLPGNSPAQEIWLDEDLDDPMRQFNQLR